MLHHCLCSWNVSLEWLHRSVDKLSKMCNREWLLLSFEGFSSLTWIKVKSFHTRILTQCSPWQEDGTKILSDDFLNKTWPLSHFAWIKPVSRMDSAVTILGSPSTRPLGISLMSLQRWQFPFSVFHTYLYIWDYSYFDVKRFLSPGAWVIDCCGFTGEK